MTALWPLWEEYTAARRALDDVPDHIDDDEEPRASILVRMDAIEDSIADASPKSLEDAAAQLRFGLLRTNWQDPHTEPYLQGKALADPAQMPVSHPSEVASYRALSFLDRLTSVDAAQRMLFSEWCCRTVAVETTRGADEADFAKLVEAHDEWAEGICSSLSDTGFGAAASAFIAAYANWGVVREGGLALDWSAPFVATDRLHRLHAQAFRAALAQAPDVERLAAQRITVLEAA